MTDRRTQGGGAAHRLAWLVRHRRAVLALWLLVMAGCAWLYLTRFAIDNGVGIWFLADDPQRAVLERTQRSFGATEWTFALVGTQDILDPVFLRDLKEATLRIESLPHVERALSIANAREGRLDDEGALGWAPLLDMAGSSPEPQEHGPTHQGLGAFAERLADSPLFAGALFRPGDARHAAVLIQVENLLDEPSPYRESLIDGVRAILGAYPSFALEGLAGTAAVNAGLNRAAARDMRRYSLAIGLLLAVCGGLALSHRRDLSVLLASVAGSVVPTMGVAAALGLKLNMLTVMLPTVLVAMGTSAVVHLILDFHRARRSHPVDAALAEGIGALWVPALWTHLTTVAGFLSLATSTVVPVRQTGLLAALGILLAYVNTFAIAPLLLRALWAGEGARPVSGRQGAGFFVRVLAMALSAARGGGRVLALAGAVSALGLLGLLRLEADTDYVRFFRGDSELRADYARLQASGFAQSYLSVRIDWPEGGAFTDQPGFAAVQGLARVIESQPRVIKVLSPGAILRETERAQGGLRPPDPAFDAWAPEALAQLLLVAESSGNLDLTDLVSGGGGSIQLLVLTEALSTEGIEGLRARIETLAVARLPPGLALAVTGTSVLWANMDSKVVSTQVQSLFVTLGVLALVLPLALRSLGLGLLGLGLSALPVAVALGLMGWMGVQVNVATCLIGGIALGVAVDDSLFYLSRVRRERILGASPGRAVRRSLRAVGASMVTSSAILICGFAPMAASDFLPSAHFGLFFALAVLLALVADLVLVPACLLLFARRREPPAFLGWGGWSAPRRVRPNPAPNAAVEPGAVRATGPETRLPEEPAS